MSLFDLLWCHMIYCDVLFILSLYRCICFLPGMYQIKSINHSITQEVGRDWKNKAKLKQTGGERHLMTTWPTGPFHSGFCSPVFTQNTGYTVYYHSGKTTPQGVKYPFFGSVSCQMAYFGKEVHLLRKTTWATIGELNIRKFADLLHYIMIKYILVGSATL